ncbi:hypothetical protein CYMTET_13776 [Cymbomonas tetramitiformis]|uniref:Uncharacterized protein n=1 Tax=Cymbomonas tetramitiformis TaxID=36881 RepID=A0AAE0LAJ5_9CHLO|nr:hypothetical protein CYMTET_13776 [Cymbomonas tetramitiformis]
MKRMLVSTLGYVSVDALGKQAVRALDAFVQMHGCENLVGDEFGRRAGLRHRMKKMYERQYYAPNLFAAQMKT